MSTARIGALKLALRLTSKSALIGAGCLSLLVGARAALAQVPPALPVAPVVAYEVVGDAIETSLTGAPGDATRGRAIVVNRQLGLCLLCHSGPFAEERFQGTLAPDLAGAGARASAGQLRLRIVDARRIHSASLMPAYHRVDGLERVAAVWRGVPLLSAQQVEDVVAFLQTLRD